MVASPIFSIEIQNGKIVGGLYWSKSASIGIWEGSRVPSRRLPTGNHSTSTARAFDRREKAQEILLIKRNLELLSILK